jgi:DNA polymerase-3 subunit delta
MEPRASDQAKLAVILLFGDYDLGIEERLADLVSRLGDPATAQANLARFSAAHLDLAALEAHLLAVPFLALRRMAVLDLGALPGRKPDLPDRFFHLLASLPPTSVLVAIEHIDYDEAERLLRRRNQAKGAQGLARLHGEHSPLYRWIGEHRDRATAREQRRPSGPAFEQWLSERARRLETEIEMPAASLLREYTGENTVLADQELRKLAAYVDGGRPITRADVERLTPFHSESNVFTMVECVANRDGSRALRLMRLLLEEEDARYVFSMIVRQFRLLLLARAALDQGLPPRQVLTESPHRLPAFAADKVAHQALGFSAEKLSDIYRELASLDLASKTGRIELEVGLEILVASLAR